MHNPNLRRALRRTSLTLCGAALAMVVTATGAQSYQPLPAPYRITLKHVEVTIHPDHSITERTENRLKLTAVAGLQYAHRMRVATTGFPGMIHPVGKDGVVEAYTLKADGKRIPAVPVPALPTPPATLAALAKRHIKPWKDPAHWLSFPQAAVGDVLVIVDQGDYEPPAPGMGNNFVLDEMLPRTTVLDDGQITLNAPAAMKLRFRLSYILPAQGLVSGGMRHWTWKYSNPTPVRLTQSMSPASMMAMVHISTFPSDDAEADFMDKRNALGLASMLPGGKFGCTWPGMANDGPAGKQAITGALETYFVRSPTTFVGMADGLNSPNCRFDDGRSKITALNHAYDAAFAQQGWNKSYDYIKTLKRRFPQNALVALAEARYWMTYAWEARGGGYADSVTDEGWKLFHQRLRTAEKVLLDSKSYAADYPHWYTDMIQVEHLLDRPAHDQAVVLEEGLRRYPGYIPMYTTFINFMQPKWDGSWEAVDRFVNWSENFTTKRDGQVMYAWLYWNIFDNLSSDKALFHDTRASWPRMNQSFRELVARHPKSSWDLNNYAHFACMAGDKATYRKLRREIGRNVDDNAWQAAPTLDACRAKFGV